jgi:hypothetical protein
MGITHDVDDFQQRECDIIFIRVNFVLTRPTYKRAPSLSFSVSCFLIFLRYDSSFIYFWDSLEVVASHFAKISTLFTAM